MAVSGRKVSDFQSSISRGSAEDFHQRCEPCLAIGQHIEAHGFCVECQEYLCTHCFAYHQRIKATRHHQLVNKDDMDKHAGTTRGLEECTEKCQVHTQEVIKFFCPVHEALGCNDCITLNHRTCDIDYIPDKCAGIGDSIEYRQVMRDLDQKVNEAEDVIKLAESRQKDIDICHDKLLKEIIEFRKEINDRLDQLQNQIQTDAGKKKFADKQIIKKVVETCTAVSSDIKQLKSILQDNKTSKQNGQLYTAIKQAQSKLKSNGILEAGRSLDQTDAQYTFEQNQILENLLSRRYALGKLSLSTSLLFSERTKTIDKLTHKTKVNIRLRTKSDKTECDITGCVVLSSSKLVLADSENKKLKVVDTLSKCVIEEKTLDSGPWDIAVLPQDKIAVTVPENREVLIMSTAGKLSVTRTFSVKEEYRGITYRQGQLYTVCSDPKCVCIIGTQGNVQNTISLDDYRFTCPSYILLSEDLTRIYISDRGSNSVISITLQGKISAEYKNTDFENPMGMLMLEDGSVLLCCFGIKGSIYRISGDLNQGQEMVGYMCHPQSLCYNPHNHEVYVGCYTDTLGVFSAK